MAKTTNIMTVLTALILLTGAGVTSAAGQGRYRNEQRRYRVNEREVRSLLRRIENGADRFKRSLDSALDRSRLDGSNREDNINQYVRDFEEATDRLRNGVNDNRIDTNDAQEVLNRARVIDNFMRRARFDSRAERDWSNLRGDLDRLARLYRINSRWDGNSRRNRRYRRP